MIEINKHKKIYAVCFENKVCQIVRSPKGWVIALFLVIEKHVRVYSMIRVPYLFPFEHFKSRQECINAAVSCGYSVLEAGSPKELLLWAHKQSFSLQ